MEAYLYGLKMTLPDKLQLWQLVIYPDELALIRVITSHGRVSMDTPGLRAEVRQQRSRKLWDYPPQFTATFGPKTIFEADFYQTMTGCLRTVEGVGSPDGSPDLPAVCHPCVSHA